MQMNTYFSKAIGFAFYPPQHIVVYPALGLVGEAGEFAEKVKKVIRDRPGMDFHDLDNKTSREMAKELGDILWYVANAAADLGYTLEEIAEMNISKLSDRSDRNVLSGSGDNR